MISKNERVIVEYGNGKGQVVGVMTINQSGSLYFFYEFDGKDYKKLGKGQNPLELESKYNIKKRMGVKE